tara:strand:- start:7863 stop:8177 length:315 start_codon:yes stop_codon:yes gene_type:complete
MANTIEPEDIHWKHIKHITFTANSHILMRDERFKIQWEQITSRDGHGKVGKSKNYYFIDKVQREFTNIDELCYCWNELHNFDDPNNEIIWIKKIVPVIKLNNKH